MAGGKHYDLLIAGGGPAGLSAAYSAARTGLHVAVFERCKEIGYPVHTSGGSWIDELRRLDIPDRFMHPIKTGYFLASQAEASFSYKEPVSCILDVRGLYQYLAVIAAKAGAAIFPASHVSTVLKKNDRVNGLRLKSGEEFFAPLLIDATGVAGVLAQQLGLRSQFKRYGLGAEYDLVAPSWPQDTIALLFGSLVGPAGYGWIFPHGDDRVRLGVGLIHPDTDFNPQHALENLRDACSKRLIGNLRLESQSALEYHTGTIPSVPPLNKTFTDGLLVVGDAAALISTLLGEGIRFAIEIGRLAGSVAAEAHESGRFDANFLARFEKRWRARYERLFVVAETVNRRIARYDDDSWNQKIRLLAKMPPQTIPPLLKGEWSDRSLLRALWQNRSLLKTTSILARHWKFSFFSKIWL